MYQDNEDYYNANSESSPLSLAGKFDSNTLMYYCAYSSGGSDWPSGSYCIAQYNGDCPSGFHGGYIYHDDEDDENENYCGGSVPSGFYGRDTLIHYCCRSDGTITSPMALPTEEPFYLYQFSSEGCQEVYGMSVRQDLRYFDDEDNANANSVHGSYPYAAGGNNHLIYFCYYY